jgi:hypothetical protein
MKLESLVEFFKHISQRETSHGIPNAFRFKSVLSSRKSGTMCPANYKYGASDQDDESQPPPVRRKRRKKASLSGITAILNPDISENVSEIPTNTTATTDRPILPTTGRPISKDTTGRPILPATSGLHTPDDTPPPDPQPTRKSDTLHPVISDTHRSKRSSIQSTPLTTTSNTPVSGSRRSQRTSMQSTPLTTKSNTSKKNSKKKSKKNTKR